MSPFVRVPGASPLFTGCVCPQAGGICLLFLSSACACNQSLQAATTLPSRVGLQLYPTALLARPLGELHVVLQLCLAQAVMQLSVHCQRLAGPHSRRICRPALLPMCLPRLFTLRNLPSLGVLALVPMARLSLLMILALRT